MADNTKLYVVAHDLHYPEVNKSALNALLDFLSQNKVAGFTFGGDQFHFDCISHHTKGKALYRAPGQYKKDVEGFDKDVLRPIEALLPKGCSRIYHLGNHERFEFDFVEEHPELMNSVDHTETLKLADRGWKIIPLGHTSKIGKLNVIHGEVLTGIGNQAGNYPAKKAVDLYGGNVLAGHTHNPQSFTKISPVEKTQKHMGWIAPCMCDVNPMYLRNRPTAWLNGFTIVEMMADGQFNVFPVIIHKGKFAYGGRTYGSK